MQLRRDLRTMRRRYEAQIDDMGSRFGRQLWIGGMVLLALVSTMTVLLFRAKRRTDQANRLLQKEIATTAQAQGERAAIEDKLRQLERLDSIGMLAGGFAHDFNNILVAIRGNAQLALTTCDQDPEQRELLHQVLESSDRAAGLCRDILAYAHSGSTPRQQVDLRHVLEGVLPLARAGFGSAIEVEASFGSDARPINVDRAQIEQVFLNILVNAGDAIDKHGSIRVSINERRLPGEAPTGHWFGEFTGEQRDCYAVTVEDTGQGMNGDTIRRIFDPFFSTRFPGRGLGLAATYGILRRHQAVVNVQSEVGHGSQFTVFLPRCLDEQAPAEEPTVVLKPQPTIEKTRHRAGDKELVLIVDDEPQVLEVSERALRSDGFTVLTAENGEHALKLAGEHGEKIKVAVLDYTMPDMDGATLAGLLHDRLPHTRTMLMSGQAEQTVRSAAPDCVLLAKPFDNTELIDAVRTLHAQV